MDLYGIGFSNIRFSSDNANNIHKYNYRINTFSEEVFMHEFIHTLERISNEHGYDTINLHDHENYGYEQQTITGLKNWYQDYITKKILDKKTNKYVGLNSQVFSLKPVNEDAFRFAIMVDFNEEPQNLFDDIKNLVEIVIEAI